jgi:uncharacterized membrane protein YdbT with pleckstrin-like domain
MTENNIIYEARLHWILFFWPALFFCLTLYVGTEYRIVATPSYILSACAVVWGLFVGLSYIFSSLVIKKRQVILSTGILIRQTIDIPLNKIESIDIRQSILGSLLSYGSLVITGTGGTRQLVNYISHPLTCRRYIEQILHD